MSGFPRRFNFNNSEQGAAAPAGKTGISHQNTYEKPKVPKFVIPKTPKSQPTASASATNRSAGGHVTPRFTFSGVQPLPKQFEPRRIQLQATQGTKRHIADRDEIDPARDFKRNGGHNPFDVSEDLDEPSVAYNTPRRTGPPRFLASQSSSMDRPVSSGKSASAVLLSLRFMETEPSTGEGFKVPADWSPHKKRVTRSWEKAKFMPGGLAETVALWIYEDDNKVV